MIHCWKFDGAEVLEGKEKARHILRPLYNLLADLYDVDTTMLDDAKREAQLAELREQNEQLSRLIDGMREALRATAPQS